MAGYASGATIPFKRDRKCPAKRDSNAVRRSEALGMRRKPVYVALDFCSDIIYRLDP